VHLFAFILLLLGLAVVLAKYGRSAFGFLKGRRGLAVLALAVCALCSYQRPVIGFSLFVGISTILLARSNRSVAALALFGAFLVWIFPEIAVTDWVYDNRTEWIRFNTAMRLWLESTYLFPLAVLLLVAPELLAVLNSPRQRLVLLSFGILFSGSVIASLYTLTVARMDRAPERPSIDGYTFLKDEHPRDYELVTYLNQLPIHVVIGEACGDGSLPALPYHYGMPGRISAFSGRPSLCGWARHTWMFQQTLRRANLANETIWQSFLSTGESLRAIYSIGSPSPKSPAFIDHALRYLKQRGVTHIVIGDLEKSVYPSADPSMIANAIKGRVIFNPFPGIGVIELG
jgi:uncharacterized membrane protein